MKWKKKNLLVVNLVRFSKVLASQIAYKWQSRKYLKKKNPSNKEKFKFKKSLIRELSILANIRHPFCLNLVNFSFEIDQPIIITPLMSNGNIYDFIKDDNKELSTQKNCSIYALYSTMDFLHKAGIIHRDLKPQNIFIDNDKNICIADFGLSRKVFQNIYLTFESMGTPLYMAPKLIEGESYTNTVDVYAFGVIYYQFFSTKMILKGQKKQPKDPNSFMFKVGNGARFVQPTNMSTKQYDFYKECTLQDLDKRPSFEKLAKKFETDESLWLDGVDKDEFLKYVEKCKKN